MKGELRERPGLPIPTRIRTLISWANLKVLKQQQNHRLLNRDPHFSFEEHGVYRKKKKKVQSVSNASENDLRKSAKKEQRGDDDVDDDGG